jgi:predicted glycosyltransferase
MTYRVFLYVQNLLGIGHLMRSYRIARAIAHQGMAVTIANGGVPTPGIDPGLAKIVQLPPVKAGPSGFSELIHPDGRIFSETDKARRRDMLLHQFRSISPHVLITEAFPFGRRQMRFELFPLLELAQQKRTLIAASIRDILQEQKNPQRSVEAADLIERYYDAVLVHGSPEFAPLDDSFALVDRIRHRIVYTGIVGPEAIGSSRHPIGREPPAIDRKDHRPGVDGFDVVVSAGGGAVGAKLLKTALAARRLLNTANSRWLVVTGPNMPEVTAQEIRQSAALGVEFRQFVADFPSALCHANLSISQAGYNTVADLLAARCRSVLVPFDEGGETEQTRRCEILEWRGWSIVVKPQTLSPETLLTGILKARALSAINPVIDLNGAANTSRILAALCQDRFGSKAV